MFIALLLFLSNWAVWLCHWLLLSWVTQLLLKRLAGFCALASAHIFRSSEEHTPEEQLCCGNIADVLTLGRWKVWVTWLFIPDCFSPLHLWQPLWWKLFAAVWQFLTALFFGFSCLFFSVDVMVNTVNLDFVAALRPYFYWDFHSCVLPLSL